MNDGGFWRRRLAVLLASDRLPGPLRRWTHAALGRDPVLARMYDDLRRVERAAQPGAPLSAGQMELLEALVLSRTAETTSARRAWAVPALAACAACAAFLSFARPSAPPPLHGTLVERGVGDVPLGLTVSCVDKATKRLVGRATAGGRTPAAALACVPGALLVFSTTNLGPTEKHVLAVGVADDGTTRWYAPFSPQAMSVGIAPGSLQAPLEVVADTGGGPVDRATSLHVLFFDAPTDGRIVERGLAAAAARGTTLRALERLPVAGAAQARIDIAWQSAR